MSCAHLSSQGVERCPTAAGDAGGCRAEFASCAITRTRPHFHLPLLVCHASRKHGANRLARGEGDQMNALPLCGAGMEREQPRTTLATRLPWELVSVERDRARPIHMSGVVFIPDLRGV